ncbi:enoyl-CoA hydratase/isomerase family protein [Variovorax sp. PBL-E5]|uniref:enoyl-CoA hydratase/isomerase family protein n=1 Tax=Variovorax sp. PBL-E5 TaxID=434014 RepID=UPI0013189717|nr:enoyl-CoA hydratase/isomerase family protein [Variovorax sp. PBL-E5]VTU37523.1 putative enoyl-CoA hydratase [Variovorax sp. PBL-E5]
MFELQVADSIATVTLARPPVNAMNDAWVEGFHALLDQLDAREDWSIFCVRSALRLFCGGADLKQIGANFGRGIEVQASAGSRYQKLFARIEALRQPTIALLKGSALGGGLELALACDLRMASEEARLGLVEVKLGLMPGAGGTQRLPRAVGMANAMKLILSGEPVTGAQALAMGLVQWAVPAAEFDARAQAVLQQFAAVAPHAAQAAKAAIRAAFDTQRDGYAVETECVKGCLAHPRTQQLVGEFLARSTQ